MQRFDCRMHLIIKQAQVNVQDLIRRCLSGDPNAQKLLFEKFVTPMTRLCIRYLKDHDQAMDSMMNGFMKVFDSLKRFEYQGEDSLAYWIRKIMVNECLMQLRKNRASLFMKVNDEHGEIGISDHDLSSSDIHLLIEKLPVGYRTVFNLYVIDGYSHKEISGLLNISESASRSQLTHARDALKKLLQKNGWT